MTWINTAAVILHRASPKNNLAPNINIEEDIAQIPYIGIKPLKACGNTENTTVYHIEIALHSMTISPGERRNS